jgi:hypothetical protein
MISKETKIKPQYFTLKIIERISYHDLYARASTRLGVTPCCQR